MELRRRDDRSTAGPSFALGAWLIMAPWIFRYGPVTRWNSAIAGLLVIVCSMRKGTVQEHFAGGWSVLWKDADRKAARNERHRQGRFIMMIVGIILAAIVMVTALYGFGYFNSPYIGTFRIAFYFSLIFLIVTLVVAAMDQSNRGYDPTPQSRENAGR